MLRTSTGGCLLPRACIRPILLISSSMVVQQPFEPVKRIWKTWAPPRCKYFIWLASLNRCWTADRLARRGMDHPDRCPLCDQQDETVQHILVTCVFARDVWFRTLSRLGLQYLTPTSNATVFQEWWGEAERNVPKQKKKRF
jgi:hypothetical protein